MASAATGALARARPLKLNPVGKKQVLLPNHVVTFVRPTDNQPPNFARFHVPLTFNKLDLRDYLFHLYGVEVRGVRSFINASSPVQKDTRGHWFRPRSQKVMIAELKKPFVWPEIPEDKTPWDKDWWDRMHKVRSVQRQEAEGRQVYRRFLLRDEKPEPKAFKLLSNEAKKTLEGKSRWHNGRQLDEKWLEASKAIRESGRGAQTKRGE